jgi:hypothetical protein
MLPTFRGIERERNPERPSKLKAGGERKSSKQANKSKAGRGILATYLCGWRINFPENLATP